MVATSPALSPATRFRYYAQRWGWLAQGLALRSMMGMTEPPPGITADVVRRVRQRYRDLLARDLHNAESGVYPARLLTDMPSRRRLPAFLAEVPRSRARRERKSWNDLPDNVDTKRYPPYYRRNFHWQSDGWFSRRSAYIYDVSVEVLFLGSADVMRRQVLPHLVREGRARGGPLKILDAACGTGRFMGQAARALPGHHFTGLDLSAWYLQEARQALQHVQHLSLVEDNAEQMPLKDDAFDVSTSIYLFHELPPRARVAVIEELKRVTTPGGLIVLMDAVQIADHPWMEPVLGAFPDSFHEPFFRSWIDGNLEAMVEAAGLIVESTETWHVSKIVTARVPR